MRYNHTCQNEWQGGPFRVEKYDINHEKFNGSKQEITRFVFNRGDSVAVLLHDTATDKLLMIEEFRSGNLAQGINPWSIEIVAGSMDKDGEDPMDAAIREIHEEAPGCEIKSCEKIISYMVSPGGSSEMIHVFLATVDSSNAKEFGGSPEEGEDIKIHKLSPPEAYMNMQNGKTVSAMSIIALQYFMNKMLVPAN